MSQCDPSPSRAPSIALAIVIIGATCLRFYHIGAQSLWFDEGYTAWLINHPASQIIHVIRSDTSPPLYYLLLHYWALVFGDSEASLRSFSALLSIAILPLVAKIGVRWIHPRAGVAAAALLALSFMQQWYGQEARSYELGCFLAVCLAYAVARHAEHRHARWLGVYVATAVAGSYTNNLLLFYIAAIGLAWLVLGGVRSRTWCAVHLCILLAYLPWMIALRSQVHRIDSGFWIPKPTFFIFAETLSGLGGIRHFWTWDQFLASIFRAPEKSIPIAGCILLISWMFYSTLYTRKKPRRAAIALVIIATGPVFLAAAISVFHTSIFLDKALLPSTPFLALLLCVPAGMSGHRKFAGPLLLPMAALLAINTLSFVHEQTKENWRAAALYARRLPEAHRLFIFVAPEAQLPFDYYYRPGAAGSETGAPSGFFDSDPPVALKRVMSDADLTALKTRLASSEYDEYLLILSHAGWTDRHGDKHPGFADPEGRTEQLLLSSLTVLERIDLADDGEHHDITIYRLARTSEVPRAFYAIDH